ncbi:MAG: DUF4417 domain-containing protein [bacterium]|nr:DUF4417 domain-containing protein [bacterium]
MSKIRATIADGCDSSIIPGLQYDGLLGIPLIKRPDKIIIPKNIVPFSKRNYTADLDVAIGFYEMDEKFADLLCHPEAYVEDLSRFSAIISPDCSLYLPNSLGSHITNIYRSRLIGCFFQAKRLYVIPQIRWGKETTYTAGALQEKAAFLGVEKHSIVAIGTYGCCQHREEKRHLKAGLSAMLDTVQPDTVLVYGPMPPAIFGEFLQRTNFVPYDNWLKRVKGGQ